MYSTVHSTLLAVTEALYKARGYSMPSFLIFLDLSMTLWITRSSFPTLANFGIRNYALIWFSSYLQDQSYYLPHRVLLLESLRGQYLVNSCSLCILLNHWLSDQVFTSLFNFPTESFRPYQTAFLTSIHGWRTIIWNSTLAKLNWYTNLRKILPCWRCQSALMPSQSSQHTQLKISWFDFRWWTQVSQYHHINHHILQISSSSTINLLASHHTEYLFYRAFKMPHDWLFLVTRI